MAGPQPPGLQYERVACLEQSRTEEMMRTEKKKKKKHGRIELMIDWPGCRVSMCVRRYACECACVNTLV